jgi:hypothetical protein
MALEEIIITQEVKSYKCSDGTIFNCYYHARNHQYVLDLMSIIEVTVNEHLTSGISTVTVSENITFPQKGYLGKAIANKLNYEGNFDLVVTQDIIDKGTYFIKRDLDYVDPGDEVFYLVPSDTIKTLLEDEVKTYKSRIEVIEKLLKTIEK